MRELLTLASWIVAFLVAQIYATAVALLLLPAAIPGQSLRLWTAFLIVFLGVLLLMTLLAIAVSGLLNKVGLSRVDRALGAVFGLVRGLAIVMVVVLLAALSTLRRQPVWWHAILSGPLEVLAKVIKVWLPYDLTKRINYEWKTLCAASLVL